MHKDGSIYDDIPEVHYQFKEYHLPRVRPLVNQWIVYLEPAKERNSKGFFAVAKVAKIVPDPDVSGRFRALIEVGTFLPFLPTVPRVLNGQPVERDCYNSQWSIRPLSNSDFARIIALGLPEDNTLPRVGEIEPVERVHERQVPFEVERPIVQSLVNRPFRDRAFRRAVLSAYDGRCAVTGWKLINGGGRLEAEAAHIRPVEHGGPDSIRNGLALSGTAHWMFDRGLIGVSESRDILIHRKVNDRGGVEAIINPTRKLIAPQRESDQPHCSFLAWHRDHHGF
nr:HNH endonuclease [Novosphingobium marinum]